MQSIHNIFKDMVNGFPESWDGILLGGTMSAYRVNEIIKSSLEGANLQGKKEKSYLYAYASVQQATSNE
jgi:hypothetical protein